jgi:putative transposase
LRTKIKNIVNDLHWKTVSFLCNNFNTIITTPFEVKKMINKSTRSINNTSVRNMLSLSHYAFRQKLISRAKQTGNKIYVLNESYTSMTCGNCGTLKDDLKGKKTYNCKKCKMKLDRDINGARNIMIRLYTNSLEE